MAFEQDKHLAQIIRYSSVSHANKMQVNTTWSLYLAGIILMWLTLAFFALAKLLLEVRREISGWCTESIPHFWHASQTLKTLVARNKCCLYPCFGAPRAEGQLPHKLSIASPSRESQTDWGLVGRTRSGNVLQELLLTASLFFHL